ncbi:hypothetical protein QTP86_023642 [Hemibagrus guttatus]|nr:hypothetical protein QTP86_023642 [Hemibagrus guttatus]
MGKRKDLSEFEKGQIVMARRLDQSISKTAALVGCSQSAVFELFTWPSNSPDLNPLQHLWDMLDKQVRFMEATPRNLQDLNDMLLTSWCQIPQHSFRNLVDVFAAKGGQTQ